MALWRLALGPLAPVPTWRLILGRGSRTSLVMGSKCRRRSRRSSADAWTRVAALLLVSCFIAPPSVATAAAERSNDRGPQAPSIAAPQSQPSGSWALSDSASQRAVEAFQRTSQSSDALSLVAAVTMRPADPFDRRPRAPRASHLPSALSRWLRVALSDQGEDSPG